MRHFVALLLTLLAACTAQKAQRLQVPELSGLTASRVHRGVYWAHGDSGNAPVLFAVDERAHTLAEVQVDGASHEDWEDIAVDGRGNLYIGDIGNNLSERHELAIHVLREPDPRAPQQVVRPVRTLRFRYPDQRDETRNFDAEALFVLADRLYLATKQLEGARTALYRVPLESTSDAVLLERIADFSIKLRKQQKNGLVTAASASPDGTQVALLTYRDVFVFRVAGPHVLEGPLFAAPAPEVAGLEALAWDAKGLLLGAESGQLVRVPVPREPAQLRD